MIASLWSPAVPAGKSARRAFSAFAKRCRYGARPFRPGRGLLVVTCPRPSARRYGARPFRPGRGRTDKSKGVPTTDQVAMEPGRSGREEDPERCSVVGPTDRVAMEPGRSGREEADARTRQLAGVHGVAMEPGRSGREEAWPLRAPIGHARSLWSPAVPAGKSAFAPGQGRRWDPSLWSPAVPAGKSEEPEGFADAGGGRYGARPFRPGRGAGSLTVVPIGLRFPL